MTKLKKHHSNNTVSSRRVKRSKNDIAIVFTKKHILNIESIKHSLKFSTKNLNITSKYLKSSHSENGETHLTIIYYLLKLDPYPYLDITRQEKKSAIVITTSVSSKNHISQRIITSLLSDPPSQY